MTILKSWDGWHSDDAFGLYSGHHYYVIFGTRLSQDELQIEHDCNGLDLSKAIVYDEVIEFALSGCDLSKLSSRQKARMEAAVIRTYILTLERLAEYSRECEITYAAYLSVNLSTIIYSPSLYSLHFVSEEPVSPTSAGL